MLLNQQTSWGQSSEYILQSIKNIDFIYGFAVEVCGLGDHIINHVLCAMDWWDFEKYWEWNMNENLFFAAEALHIYFSFF